MANITYIQDRSASNALFSGVELYFLSTAFTANGSNTAQPLPRTSQPLIVTEDGSGDDVLKNSYNRRKGDVQGASFNNPTYSVTIIFESAFKNTATRTIKGTTYNMLTYSKLMSFILTPKVYYIRDDNYMQYFDGQAHTIYGTAIPVVLQNWKTTTFVDTNDIQVTLAFVEAKEQT